MIRKKDLQKELSYTKLELRNYELKVTSSIADLSNTPDVDRMSNSELLDELFNRLTRIHEYEQ